MRTGRLRFGAGLGVALLLAAGGLRAQEVIPPPSGQPVAPPPAIHSTHSGAMAHQESAHNSGHGVVEEGCKEEERGLFFMAEYQIVRPRRRAFDFAIVDPTLDSSIGGNVRSLDWETDSAYRLTAGYRFGQGMELAASYFYTHSKENQSVNAPLGGALFATLTPPNIDQADSAIASTNLDMDVIDVELARRLEVNENLHLRLAGGGRVATIQQKLNAFYTGGTAGDAGTFVSSPINFDGIGVKAGGEATYKLMGNFGVYARANMSLLSGDFRTRLTTTTNGGATTLINVEDKFRKVVPVSELGLGLAYQGDHLRVSVGYEIANYFNLVDSVDFVESTSFGKIGHRSSDLSLEGLAFSVGLSF